MKAAEFGRWGEERAAAHLQSMGYEIVARNWRSEYGEIDLVARHDATWVFVEVKARRSDEYGKPEEAITPAKQRHLLETALAYLGEHDLDDVDWRVDVVAISVMRADYAAPQIEVYQNAVSEW